MLVQEVSLGHGVRADLAAERRAFGRILRYRGGWLDATGAVQLLVVNKLASRVGFVRTGAALVALAASRAGLT